MLSATGELAAYHVDVHAKIGRQFSEGVRVVRRLLRDHELAKRVIVHLGTNGPIDPHDCDRLVTLAGPHRRVFLVTIKVPRTWQDSNNAILGRCAAASDKVDLIRWYARSHGHGGWFVDDRYHLSDKGQRKYAHFIDRSIDEIVAG